jgi:hypothetical protein
MSVLKVIDGITKNLFRLGLGGPQLKNNSGVVEHRNNDDSGFAIARAADPIGNDDLVNKGWLETNYGGEMRTLRISITSGDAPSKSSTKQIPANAIVLTTEVDIDTPFDNAATIEIGYTGTTNALMATTENDPLTAGNYRKEEAIAWDSSDRAVLVTIANAPTVGAGTVTVTYTEPDS